MTKTARKCLLYSIQKKEGVSHSQSVDPDQSRTATMFEKSEGANKIETECIPKTAPTSRAISRSETKNKIFDAIGAMTSNITKITASLESMPPTSVDISRESFFSCRTVYQRLGTRLIDKSVNYLSFLRAYFKSM